MKLFFKEILFGSCKESFNLSDYLISENNILFESVKNLCLTFKRVSVKELKNMEKKFNF